MESAKQTIQTRIIAFMVILGIMIGVGTGLGVLQTTKNELVTLEREKMSHAVALAGEKLHNDLRELGQDVLFVMGTPPIEGIIRSEKNGGLDPMDGSTQVQWRTRLATIFENMLRAKSDYLSCSYIGVADGGRELVRVDLRQGLIHIVEEKDLQQKGDASYFKAQLLSGKVNLSKIHLARENDQVLVPHQPVIQASTPIYDGRKLYGVIVITIDYEKRLELVAQQLSGFKKVYITNQHGDYLYHPDPAKTFGFDLGAAHQINREMPVFNHFFESNLARDFITTKSENDEQLAFIQRFPFETEASRFLTVAVSHPLNRVLLTTRRVRNQSLMIMTGMILLSAMLAMSFSQKLVVPIREITTAAQRLSEGDFQVDLPTRANGEIGQLALSLEVMTRNIQDRTVQLEQSEAYNRAILDNALDCIITIDEKGTVMTCNPALERVFGYKTNEVIGQNVKMLMPSPDRENHDGYLKQYLLTHVKTIIDSSRKVMGRRKDGSTFTLNLSVTELISGDQRFFTGFIKDISEEEARRLQEARLTELAETMTGAKNLNQLSSRILSFLANHFDIHLGAIYLPENHQMLRRTASYALEGGDQNLIIPMGEGLVGQTAIDHKIKVMNDTPDHYFKMKTHMGDLAPRQIILYPILYENELVAIFELGRPHHNEKTILDFLHAAAHLTSVTFKTSQSLLTH